jgi:hypothetical protein
VLTGCALCSGDERSLNSVGCGFDTVCLGAVISARTESQARRGLGDRLGEVENSTRGDTGAYADSGHGAGSCFVSKNWHWGASGTALFRSW